MLRFLPPALILICVVTLLLPALTGGHALLPSGDLAFMLPWNSVLEPSDHQWNPLMWDALAQFHPWRDLYHRSLHQGQLPLWNPYQFSGTPFLANVQSAILYPPNLIFCIFDPARAFGISAVLHLFLAGLFTYMFSSSLGASRLGATISGLTFALCAFNITWLELPTFVCVATWLPLVLLLIRLALRRRSIILCIAAGLAVGLSLLAGHFQIALYVILAAVAWWLWEAIALRKSEQRPLLPSAGYLTVILTIGFSLAAAQIIPALELARLSHRVSHPTMAGYFNYINTALPSINLVTAFVPDFFGNPSRNTFWGIGNYTEYAMYVGILPLILAIGGVALDRRGRPSLFFALMAGFALLTALGTQLDAILYFGIPGFSSTGSPARILVLYCFAIAVLAGFGATSVTTGWKEKTPHLLGNRISITLLILGVAICAFLASGLYAKYYINAVSEAFGEQAPLGFYSIFIAVGFTLASAAVLLWRAAGMVGTSFGSAALLILTVADLMLFGYHFNAVSSRQSIYPPTTGISFLQEVAGHERIMPINKNWSLTNIPRAVLPPNSATVYGIHDTQGYDSLFPGYYKRFAAKLLGDDPSPVQNGNIVFFKQYNERAARYARYMISEQTIAAPELLLVYQDEYLIYENLAALPRAEVLMQPSKTHGPPSMDWAVDSLNLVELRVDSGYPSKLILRDTIYPGWKAYVNNRPAKITPAEDIFRSVDIPKGISSITFRFEPSSFRVGLYISLLCLAACSAALCARLGIRAGSR
ncbi:MAG: hypothetical protein Q7N50_13115 [Armatimonadota bacterium]|nr:hypothetical protein [Armatimonadota bacterium]